MILNNEDLSYKNGDSATVSVGDWLLLDAIGFLNLIPIAGSIACLVLYVVIAATRTTAPSVQNRIIASLIWLGVWVLVFLVCCLLLIAGVLNMGAMLGGLQSALVSSN